MSEPFAGYDSKVIFTQSRGEEVGDEKGNGWHGGEDDVMGRLMRSFSTGFVVVTITMREMLMGRKLLVMGLFGIVPIIITAGLLNASYLTLDALSNIYLNYHIQIMALLISVIYASALINNDILSGNVVHYTTRYLSRPEYVGYRYLGYIIIAPLPTIISATVCYGIAYFGHVDGVESAGTTLYASYIAGIILATIAYGAFFAFLGVILSKPHIPALLIAFIWENLIARTYGRLPMASILYHVRAFVRNYVSIGDIARYKSYSPVNAMIVILIFSIITVVLAGYILARKDLDVQV